MSLGFYSFVKIDKFVFLLLTLTESEDGVAMESIIVKFGLVIGFEYRLGPVPSRDCS